MHILVNGESREVGDDTCLADLLSDLQLQNARFAVEINEELIPRNAHATHTLQADDRVEIVQAIGGG